MNLLDRLKQQRSQRICTPLHPGELTTEQWARKWDTDVTSARKYLKDGVATGIIITRMAKVKGAAGLIRRAQVWREKR